MLYAADSGRCWCRNWTTIHQKRHVVVHLPSASLSASQRESLPLAHVRENAQMARMCDLADPLVEVVYVAPFSLTTVGA